jgi:hypothetical protein
LPHALGGLWLLLGGCVGSGKVNKPVQILQLLNAVDNKTIQFATIGDVRTGMPTIDRRVVVTGPADVVTLLSTGDVRVLQELVKLLPDPQRAWAAEVVLASLTGHEDDIVNAFAAHPDQWQDAVGRTAYGRWTEWLRSHEEALSWDHQTRIFKARTEQ